MATAVAGLRYRMDVRFWPGCGLLLSTHCSLWRLKNRSFANPSYLC